MLNNTETTMAKIAAIGTDGMRAVVWGIGDTEIEAEAAALQDDGEGVETTLGYGFVYVPISDERARSIDEGDVDADDLVEADGRGGIRARRRPSAEPESSSRTTDARACGASETGWNVWRFRSEDPANQELVGSAETEEGAHRLASPGDQIQRGFDGPVENV